MRLTSKILQIGTISFLATACQFSTGIALKPSADDVAAFRVGLITASQNDLDTLDRPTRYTITMTFDPTGPTLNGSEEVRYTNRQSAPLNEIYFRLFANYPGSGGKITVSNLILDSASVPSALQVENTALHVPLSKPLAPSASLDAHLDFSVTIPRESKAHYADFTSTGGIVTLPSVYPLIPSCDNKGWHTELPPAYGDLVYADASLYEVNVTVPSAMTVVASGSTVERKDNGNGTTTWKLIAAPARDFDINISDRLQKSSAQVGETLVNSYYEASDEGNGKNALQFAVDALKIYSTRFGSYPYREFDVIETPTTAGGIEYPGVAIIARTLYSNPRQRDYFEFATAHEVAHQWWYGMVGDDQVNEPWVDESLAQYSSLIYYQDLKGASAGDNILRGQFQAAYERAKSDGRDKAVNLPVSAYNEADYSAIVYQKGPLFHDALRKKMGDARFFDFLQTYLVKFRWKSATGNDIVATASGACGCDVSDVYQEWIASPK
jgi:peptidase M1-like protein